MRRLRFLWRVVREAWYETLARWGHGPYTSLDCLDGEHVACEFCHCDCHRVGDPGGIYG